MSNDDSHLVHGKEASSSHSEDVEKFLQLVNLVVFFHYSINNNMLVW